MPNGHKNLNTRMVLSSAVIIFFAVMAIAAVRAWRSESPQSVDDTAVSEQDGLSHGIVITTPEAIPAYNGTDIIVLNDNQPNFTSSDLIHIDGETYSPLDALGRCGEAIAKLDRSMMPLEERGSIGTIKPSGWHQEKYPGIVDSDPPYLYHRCHLIAYALTGQNDNERNLITGTRYLNVELMLSYEIQVAQYLDDSDNHVLYRVTPYFADRELVARGVEMEAYSIEDEGAGVRFHVFLYNVQPGVEIDYATGESRTAE